MIIPTSRQTASGITGRFRQWTGAALGAGRPTITGGDFDVSGTIRSGNGNAGGDCDSRFAVRARPVLGERPFRRGQPGGSPQMVQSRGPEGTCRGGLDAP